MASLFLLTSSFLAFGVGFVSGLFLCLASVGFVGRVLRADALKDGEATLRWQSNVESANIRVGNLIDSGLHYRGIFIEQILIASSLLIEIRKVTRKMTELTACSILAEAITSLVALAEGHAELAGNMCLLHELVLTVGEGALSTELALLSVEPEFANFGLLLLFVGGLVGLHIVS